MYVEQIMSRKVDTVAAETKLSHASQLMHEKRRRFLPVVDADMHLAGLLTHRELARSEPSSITTLSVGEVNYLTSKITVEQIMQKSPLTCTPDTLVEEAGHMMRQEKIGCLPVIEGGVLVGVITEDDILDFLLDITGCSLHDTARLALHLPDVKGALGTLLDQINDLGGYIATVVSPMTRDETGMRVVIVRFRAENPRSIDDRLRELGYDLITEVLPEQSHG
jgi:acetoin utilization protein AcuB